MSQTPHHSYDKIIKENLEAVLLHLQELSRLRNLVEEVETRILKWGFFK